MKKRTIKEIALELLEKYHYAKEGFIWECSGDIEDDIKKLKKEVSDYKNEIQEGEA